jgi:putative transposase
MRLLSNSYARYFNKKTRRNGPLWECRFKATAVQTDEYALHLSRYIHLNPTSAGLVAKPEEWEFSSYREYLRGPEDEPICDFRGVISLSPELYRKFTENRRDYQRSLQILKVCLFD